MTSAARAGASRREGWLDALRVLAAFGVIVNHTNSKVFQALTPQDAQWWLSVGWYYVSKMAVPLFVMVSGACLLPRRDSPRRVLGRMARILGALLLFSYAYYLYDAWVYWGLWPRMADLGTFLRLVWMQQITDSFWYLTFYLALLAMLPFLQRLASALSGRGVAALAGICLLWDGLWPLAAHYVPAISPPAYLDAPLFSVYVGLFFAGYWLRRFFSPTRGRMRLAWAVLAASLLASVLLTFVEYGRVAPGEKYWFMDDRMHPSLLTAMSAASAMALMRGARWPQRNGRALTELGGCAFGIYLAQDWLIAQTQERLFLPLCGALPPLAAALVWELAVFALALGAAWLMRRVPGLRKIV